MFAIQIGDQRPTLVLNLVLDDVVISCLAVLDYFSIILSEMVKINAFFSIRIDLLAIEGADNTMDQNPYPTSLRRTAARSAVVAPPCSR